MCPVILELGSQHTSQRSVSVKLHELLHKFVQRHFVHHIRNCNAEHFDVLFPWHRPSILFARLSRCADFSEMCVTVPRKTNFEPRTTAQTHSLSGCGFPSLPFVVFVTLVDLSFSKLVVLSPNVELFATFTGSSSDLHWRIRSPVLVVLRTLCLVPLR